MGSADYDLGYAGNGWDTQGFRRPAADGRSRSNGHRRSNGHNRSNSHSQSNGHSRSDHDFGPPTEAYNVPEEEDFGAPAAGGTATRQVQREFDGFADPND